MTQKTIQNRQVYLIFRLILFFILIICGILLGTTIVWIFNKIYHSGGLELAEVTIAIICILTLILILVGLRAGLSLHRLIQHQNPEVWSVYHSSGQVRSLFKLLGYEETNKPVPSGPTEPATLLSNTTPRRGRPPTYSLERWTKVVLAWENRDPLRNPMTLTQFLCEQFGENADGSPRISENCFYTNRKKVIDQLRQQTGVNQY